MHGALFEHHFLNVSDLAVPTIAGQNLDSPFDSFVTTALRGGIHVGAKAVGQGLAAADQDTGGEYQRAPKHHLKCGAQPRCVHVFVLDPGDRPKL